MTGGGFSALVSFFRSSRLAFAPLPDPTVLGTLQAPADKEDAPGRTFG